MAKNRVTCTQCLTPLRKAVDLLVPFEIIIFKILATEMNIFIILGLYVLMSQRLFLLQPCFSNFISLHITFAYILH